MPNPKLTVFNTKYSWAASCINAAEASIAKYEIDPMLSDEELRACEGQFMDDLLRRHLASRANVRVNGSIAKAPRRKELERAQRILNKEKDKDVGDQTRDAT